MKPFQNPLDDYHKIGNDIDHELSRQMDKWGIQCHGPFKWLAIVTEEVGEVAEAMLNGDTKQARAELVQVAASAIAAIECIDRNWKEE